jgi:hypothetical protein
MITYLPLTYLRFVLDFSTYKTQSFSRKEESGDCGNLLSVILLLVLRSDPDHVPAEPEDGVKYFYPIDLER